MSDVVVDAESMWNGKIRVDGDDATQAQGQPSGFLRDW